MIEYSDEVKKNCIRLRHKFGDSTAGQPMEDRHRQWVIFVDNSNLTDEEKLACKVEFLNPEDEWRYNK